MQRPETKLKRRWKFYATNQVHKIPCIGLTGEGCETVSFLLPLASTVE
jgi:hypothetical protein